jgi:C-terminal processing protease CtpA/Prc
MVRSIRTPFLFSLSTLLAVGAPLGAPLHAQGTTVIVRRPPRAASADENELRRLERRADSLAYLYNESDDLSAARRRAIGDELDRTVAQIEQLTRRMAEAESRAMGVRMRVAPMVDERDAAAMSSALSQGRVSQVALPRGWMGVNISGTARESRFDNGELIIHYLTYPVILSVDPSSGAAKAGLRGGDTLVAFDGQDVRDRDISLTKLVRPNARVLVRIRRDGRTREVPVTIADVPSRIRLRSEANLELRSRGGGSSSSSGGGMAEIVAFPRLTTPPMPMTPRIAPVSGAGSAPLPPGAVPNPATIYSFGLTGVAGAQLVPLTEGLARTVGVERGVLVTYAAVGSPAYSSGLRDGDVIVRVSGEPVRTVAEVREQVQIAVDNGESAVELDVVRDKQKRRLTLSWSRDR